MKRLLLRHVTQNEQRPRGWIRWAVMGSLLALAAAAVAGCGSGGDATAANANANAGKQGNGAQGGRPKLSSDQKARFKQFRDCMNRNGVDLPDFSDGPPQGGPPGGFDPSSSKFRSAIRKCAKYAPRGGPPGAQGGQGGPPGGMGGPPSGMGGGSGGGAGSPGHGSGTSSD